MSRIFFFFFTSAHAQSRNRIVEIDERVQLTAPRMTDDYATVGALYLYDRGCSTFSTDLLPCLEQYFREETAHGHTVIGVRIVFIQLEQR